MAVIPLPPMMTTAALVCVWPMSNQLRTFWTNESIVWKWSLVTEFEPSITKVRSMLAIALHTSQVP